MPNLKVKKSILVFFLLVAFFACFFCSFCFQKTYAEEQKDTSYFNYISEDAIGNQNADGQNTSNLCWAFSGTKVIESFLYNKAHNSSPANDATLWKNFAESWVSLAYMYYVNDSENPNIEYVTSNKNGQYVDNMNYVYNSVGNIYLLERVTNTYGLVYEGSEEGKCPIALTVNCTYPENENYYTNVFYNYKDYAAKTIVKNIEFRSIVNYASTSYEHTDKTKEFNEILSRMKHYLKNFGALSTYVANGHTVDVGDKKFVFYDDTSSDTKHALTIIGYDDEMTFTNNSKEYKGAFKTVNSTSSTPSYVWIPYEMYRPSIEKTETGKTENNNILSNTYFIYHIESGTSDEWTANTYVVPLNYASTNINSFFDNIINFFGDNSTVKIITAIIAVVFLITIIVLLINYTIRKKQTALTNKSAMIKTIANYQAQQVEIERQKQELDEEIQQMRYEAFKKKQRRLKRQFQKKLEEMKNNQDSENKS